MIDLEAGLPRFAQQVAMLTRAERSLSDNSGPSDFAGVRRDGPDMR